MATPSTSRYPPQRGPFKRRRLTTTATPSTTQPAPAPAAPTVLEDGELPVSPPSPTTNTDTMPATTGDSDSAEEGELTPDVERAAIDVQVRRDLTAPPASVHQRDARYFTLDSVVCAQCGVKGHLSYACTEVGDTPRCYSCGATSHVQRDCPHKAARRRPRGMQQLRRVGAPRQPRLHCYVCGAADHLDCSASRWTPVLSCYNCGQRGHAGHACNMPGVDVVLSIVRDMERMRKERMMSRGKGKDPGDRWMNDPVEFRHALMTRLRQRRYSGRRTDR